MQDQLSRTKITLKCEVIRAMLCLYSPKLFFLNKEEGLFGLQAVFTHKEGNLRAQSLECVLEVWGRWGACSEEEGRLLRRRATQEGQREVTVFY